MSLLEVSCFGTFQAKLAGVPLTNFRSVNTQGLLIYLIMQAERPFPRDALATLFWPDETDANAKKNLRQTLYQLRQILQDGDDRPHPFLVVTRQTIQWNPASAYNLDSKTFLAELARGRLATAVDRYRGELLTGFTCDSLEFEAWLRQERERLHRLALTALSDLTASCLDQADFAAAEAAARRQLALEPWRESAHRQLMRALALAGDRTAALAQVDLCEAALADELGAPLSDETILLARQIEDDTLQRADPALLAGRFSLGEEIGRGGVGVVYKGVDRQAGVPVAVKVLDTAVVAQTPELLDRFQREGELLRRLDHPNIVKRLAMVEKEGQHYLVMNYVAGGDLRQRLQQQQLPLADVLRIGIDLADALARVHRLGILHRDLKPANVLLDEDGTPYLTDFGAARLEKTSDLTRTGAIIGTTIYQSPEACLGQPLDERADVWGLGLILAEMLTGERPFARPTPAATYLAILNEPLPDFTQHEPPLPTPLLLLLDKMLHKEKSERIASMRQVGAILEAIQRGAAVPAFATLPEKPAAAPAASAAAMPAAEAVAWPNRQTPFVGRTAELMQLVQMLGQADGRLITVVGAGGVGKTRLAVQVAQLYQVQTKQPACFITLEGMTLLSQLETAVAAALGKANGDAGSGAASPAERVAGKPTLLLLDNIETLLAADGRALVNWLLDLLAAAPTLRLLLTSRQPLQIQAEQVVTLTGLPVPESAQVTLAQAQQYEAIALFVQRARQANAAFRLSERNVAALIHLCRLLEGLPLGIELAAAQTRHYRLAEIVQALESDMSDLAADRADLLARHRSLFAVFEQSWAALSDDEQRLLAKTAVFHDGFSRAAAFAVLDAGAAQLEALIDRSLLARQETPQGIYRVRYRLPSLLRLYLLARHEPAAALYDRHAAYYLAWAVEHRERLAAELANVRAAWAWAQARRQVRVPRRWDPNWLDSMASETESVAVARMPALPETAVLVGRDQELAALRTALQPLRQGGQNAGLITLLGEAGMGKSFLVAQLQAAGERLTWFECPCDEQQSQSLRPFRVWLSNYFRQEAEQSAEQNRAAFRARLDDLIQATTEEALAAELERLHSLLAALVDLALPDSLYSRLRPEQRSEKFQQAIKALVQAESLLQPLVLHVEDAHWLDAETRDLLENLLRHADGYPCAIMVTARPGGFAPLVLLDAGQTTVRLEPLSSEAVRQLATYHLGSAPEEALQQLLQTQGNGNPFYTEQLLRYMQENGLVVEGRLVRGSSRASLDALLPVDVQNLLVSRLGLLDTAVRDVAVRAAVLGHEFSLPVLRRLVPASDLDASLAAGQAAAIWQPVGTDRYVFNHALFREAATAAQFAERRQQLHQKAAEAVTAVATTEQPHLATIAYHHDEAGNGRQAVAYYLKAGDEAQANYFIREARGYYTRGLELAQTDKQRLPLLLGREAVNHWLGNREEQKEDLLQLVALAASAGNREIVADVGLRQATFALVTGDYAGAIRHAQRTTSLAVSVNDRVLEAKAMHRWGRALWQQGKPRAAVPLLERALKLAETGDHWHTQASCLYDLSILAYYDDAYVEARSLLDRAIHLFEENDDKRHLIRCINMLGLIEKAQGSYEAALVHYQRSVDMCQTLDWPFGEALMTGHLGNCHFELGNYDLCRQLHKRALAIGKLHNDLEGQSVSLDTIGLTYLFQGDLQTARAKFEAALAIGRELENVDLQAYAATHLGLALTDMEEVEQAGVYLYEAMGLRQDVQAGPVAVDTQAALAWLDLARGDGDFAADRARKILARLGETGPAGVELPLLVYWQCYTILRLAGSVEEAQAALQAAYELLQARAQRIEDETLRRTFLNNSPYHQQVVSAWRALH